jgi:L-rhamnose isomerase
VKTKKAYKIAKEQYSKYDIDTDEVLTKLRNIPISIHCWQADDARGFERQGVTLLDGGIFSTGNYPSYSRNINELRYDIEKAFSLIAYFGHIRTLISETSGQRNGIIRTP